MAETFDETITHSYGSRIKNSFGGIIFGLLLLIGSSILLWWNEDRTLTQANALEEGLAKTVTLATPTVNSANDHALIYTTGTLTGDELRDPTFGINVDAVVLERRVTMYQYQEHVSESEKQEVGGSVRVTKHYSYDKTWSSSPINSSRFKEAGDHYNPPFAYNAQHFNAQHPTLGDFSLSSSIINRAEGFERLHVEASTLQNTSISDGDIYIGKDPQNPKIGDMKISYNYLPSHNTYSVIAAQLGSTLDLYTTSQGAQIAFLKAGVHTPQAIFAQAQSENNFMAWLLRAVGLLLMFIGFMMILGPLQILASIIPFLGSIVGVGSSLIALLLTLLLGGSIIVISWFAQRPLLTAGLIALVIGLIFLMRQRARRV